MLERLTVLALACALAGCQTPYQAPGLRGGVQALQVTADTYRIESRGNGFTSASTVQDYVLLRAAETTIAAGGTHFVVLGSADRSRRFIGQSPGSATTTLIGRTAITTYSPGDIEETVKPGQDTFIRVFKVRPGETPPAGAVSAQQIVTFVGARVRRG